MSRNETISDPLGSSLALSRPRRLSDEELDALAATVPILIKRYDTNFRCTYICSTSEHYTAKPPSWFIGRHLDDYEGYPEEFVSTIKSSIKRIVETGEPQIFETSLAKPSGARRRVHHQCPEYNDQGELFSIVSITIDVTEKHNSASRLQQTLTEQTSFLAMLAHELRNPLAAVSNGLEALARHPGAEISQIVQALMRKELSHITRLIEDLLDTSRLETGALKYQKTECTLRDCLDLACEFVGPLLNKAGQQLVITGDEAEFPLLADANRVAQAISNILHNASKFSPRGATVSLHIAAEERSLRLEIADQGSGIPPQIRETIFERYAQGNREHDSRESGLGLGLFVSRQIIREHGGDITIAASSEAGTTFRLILPIHSGQQLSSTRPTSPAPKVSGASVLVIDDNVSGLESMKLLLELDGHEVLTASDGAEGARLYARHQPAVVLLDIGLPDMNGCVLAQRLRLIPRKTAPLLIAITGRCTVRDELLSMEAGFDAHLTKPANIDEIYSLISKHLEKVA